MRDEARIFIRPLAEVELPISILFSIRCALSTPLNIWLLICTRTIHIDITLIARIPFFLPSVRLLSSMQIGIAFFPINFCFLEKTLFIFRPIRRFTF
jgi:hypothetical protein